MADNEDRSRSSWSRASIGTRESHRATVRGLGPAQASTACATLEDTPAVRGMINKVSYLVQVL